MTHHINPSHSPAAETKRCRWDEFPELYDRSILIEYLKMGYSLIKIAEEVGCTRFQVSKAIRYHGINRATVMLSEEMTEKLRLKTGC